MLGCNSLARSLSRSLSLFFVFLSFDCLSRVCSFLTPPSLFLSPFVSLFFFVRYPADVDGWRYVQEHRQSLEGARVSFEAVDTRAGRAWWQCLLCDPEVSRFFLFSTVVCFFYRTTSSGFEKRGDSSHQPLFPRAVTWLPTSRYVYTRRLVAFFQTIMVIIVQQYDTAVHFQPVFAYLQVGITAFFKTIYWIFSESDLGYRTVVLMFFSEYI